MVRDLIRRLEEQSQQLEVEKRKAEASSRAKSEFLANMIHEIRTPMNGILGMTELTLASNLSPKQRAYLTTVQTSGQALLVLLNDVLDFSQIEAGQLRLDARPFALRQNLEAILQPFILQAREKGLHLTYTVQPDVPDLLIGNHGRVRQIFLHVVGNAIKFTTRGTITIRIAAEPAASSRLHIMVQDTGIGIPAAKQQAIFEAFEQADTSTTRRHGGTGLGLALVARLVALMHGRIWVESEAQQGSTFHFILSLQQQFALSNSSMIISGISLLRLPSH